MELAAEIEVPIVVLHLGEVDTYDRSYLMYDFYEYGEREFEAFGAKVEEATEWRKRKEAKHQDAVLFSLDMLNEMALRLEVYLAIENRPRYYQIPNFDEVGLFLEKFKGSNMRYWHDVGHAMLQERVGLCWSQRWLETYTENLIGVNLHDLKDLEAYHPPGSGDLDFQGDFGADSTGCADRFGGPRCAGGTACRSEGRVAIMAKARKTGSRKRTQLEICS